MVHGDSHDDSKIGGPRLCMAHIFLSQLIRNKIDASKLFTDYYNFRLFTFAEAAIFGNLALNWNSGLEVRILNGAILRNDLSF